MTQRYSGPKLKRTKCQHCIGYQKRIEEADAEIRSLRQQLETDRMNAEHGTIDLSRMRLRWTLQYEYGGGVLLSSKDREFGETIRIRHGKVQPWTPGSDADLKHWLDFAHDVQVAYRIAEGVNVDEVTE